MTAEEYEAAAHTCLTCLDTNEAPHSDPILDTSGRIPQWSYPIGPLDGPGSLLDQRYNERCTQHLSPVEFSWSMQHQPGVDEVASRQQNAIDCAIERGLAVTSFDERNGMMIDRIASESDLEIARRCIAFGWNGVPYPDQP